MSRRSKVTIRDVANLAGVSITAVSHALNGKGTLSADTREKVQAAATQLGYQADVMARAMRAKAIGAVGLIIRPLDDLGSYRPQGVDFFTRFSGAAAHAAADRGLALMLVPGGGRNELPPLAWSLDGFIVTDPTVGDPVVELLEERDMPLVTVGKVPQSSEQNNWVSSDDQGNVRLILEHLTSRGVGDLLFVAGTDDNAWNLDGIAALEAWQRETGVRARIKRVRESEGESGGRAVARAAMDESRPDAIFCLTGRHAAGVVAELRDSGSRIPEDVVVAASSDSEQTRAASITAIDMHPIELAAVAVDLIDCIVRDDARVEDINHTLVTGEILARDSTGRFTARSRP